MAYPILLHECVVRNENRKRSNSTTYNCFDSANLQIYTHDLFYQFF